MIRSEIVRLPSPSPMSSSSMGRRLKRKPSLLSASKIVADTTRASHLLKIEGYSSTSKATPNGKCIYSHPFKVGGYSWRIRYYPNGRDKYSSNHVSLYLTLDQDVDEPVQVQYDLRFVDQDEDEESPLESREVTTFKSFKSYGVSRFYRRTELETSRHLRDDAFTVQCDMVVIEFVAGEDSRATVPVPPSNLQEHLRELLVTEHGADVVFKVGGETLAAHRCMLAVRSPVFNAELFGAMKESSTGVVSVDDMEPEVFRALLYFIYTDMLPEMSNNREEEYVMAQHLLVASDKYNLERLKFICQQNLCKHIEASNVTLILELAEQHQCPALKNACFQFLRTPAHLQAALGTDSFKHMSRNCPSMMMELVANLGGTQAKASNNSSSFLQFY